MKESTILLIQQTKLDEVILLIESWSKTVVETVSISDKECLALVERLAASNELRRAARLREFLVYVCDQTLRRGSTRIHEQEIGEAVFGRPSSYDTSSDNIVRVNATELRKRLEHYFAEEGANEETILEIPRGSYTPVFRRRTATPSPQESVSTVSSSPDTTPTISASTMSEPPTESHQRFVWVWQAATAILLAASLTLLWQNLAFRSKLQPWTREPALRTFWSEMLNSGETDIVLADTSFALAEDIMQRSISLTDYLNYNYKHFAEDPSFSSERRKDLGFVLERNNGSIGDFRVAQQILMNSDREHANLKFAREYTPDAAKTNSLILIGSRTSNPWVDLFTDKLNFSLQYDSVQHFPYVVNRVPRSGEQSRYPMPQTAYSANTGYGVIAYLPDFNGKRRTLILEGTDSQATAATGEFITSEENLASFERLFPPGPIPSFEILLRTSQLSGTPLHAEIAAYRIYSNPK